MSLETILILPDLHAPFHDKRAWDLVLKVGKAIKPHHLIHLGDLVDFYALSFHDKDPARALDLAGELESGKQALRQMKALGAKNNVLLGSNHHDRMVRYMRQKAPELHSLLDERTLLDLDKIGFKLVPYRQSYKLGKMRYTHDVGIAGMGAAKKSMEAVGKNLVIGHVHRIEYSVGGTLEGEHRLGVSFGWLGDKNAIDYMHRDKVAKDWALGFGVGYLDTETQFTHLQPISIMPDYSCVVNGKLYRQGPNMGFTETFKKNEALYLPLLAQAFAARGLPPELGPAIGRQESNFDPNVSNLGPGDLERGGSYGLCQMSLQTAQALGYKGEVAGLHDPHINAALAADLFVENRKRHSDLRDIIAMYNSGKPFDLAPTKTRAFYVQNVVAYMKMYAPRCSQYAPAGLPGPAA